MTVFMQLQGNEVWKHGVCVSVHVCVCVSHTNVQLVPITEILP